jgi:hypothetical protein
LYVLPLFFFLLFRLLICSLFQDLILCWCSSSSLCFSLFA